jgi:2-polyprenyl-3-methyl-5-hydroxy-6-metoxy-1,4-benzoquinol methylase
MMKTSSLREEVQIRTFHFLRRFKPVRERVTPGEFNDHVEREHVARYEFAKRFCHGRAVADIACGTGYGMKILGAVASSVDGYDKEPLCRNTVIDLDRESWTKSYDVIVSFETIEHLDQPAFFLENAQRTAQQLIVSTPIGEFRGYNPHHKQVWSLAQFGSLLETYFDVEYFFQNDEVVEQRPVHPIRFVVGVCKPTGRLRTHCVRSA